MDTFTIVRPEHLNHYGHLFGGQMLRWVDEYAFLVAAREFPAAQLVTRALDKVVFNRSVTPGSMLRFHIKRERLGTTSATYLVLVYARTRGAIPEEQVFETSITFVNVGDDGKKAPLEAPITLLCERKSPDA